MRVTPKLCKRNLAKPGKSANHLSFGIGLNNPAAAASPSQKAATTSAPTSKAAGPIQGPSHTKISSGFVLQMGEAASNASSTPWPMSPASPRQPACAAATQRPETSHINTGKQSATMMVQATPEATEMQASACVPSSLDVSSKTD
jgi:hypothetical protein